MASLAKLPLKGMENQGLEALKEIGFKRALKYVWLTFVLVVFKALIFSPFRVLLLRLLGARVGRNVVIHRVNFFNYDRKGFSGLKIGDNSFIGGDVLIDLADEVTISEHVTLAERVAILTHTNVGYKDHPLQKHFPPFTKPVILRKGSFIGVNAIILPGVEVGECVFAGAGSVVNRDVPSYAVVAGVPAKVIRKLEKD